MPTKDNNHVKNNDELSEENRETSKYQLICVLNRLVTKYGYKVNFITDISVLENLPENETTEIAIEYWLDDKTGGGKNLKTSQTINGLLSGLAIKRSILNVTDLELNQFDSCLQEAV